MRGCGIDKDPRRMGKTEVVAVDAHGGRPGEGKGEGRRGKEGQGGEAGAFVWRVP